MRCLLQNSLLLQFARAKARLFVPLFFGILAFSCNNRSPLHVVQSGDKVTLDVQTLGEYQTTIGRIQLSERNTGRVVWEVRTESGTPQINQIVLHAGQNSAALDGVASGRYVVVAPVEGQTFLLEHGIDYDVQIWKSTARSAAASARFRF